MEKNNKNKLNGMTTAIFALVFSIIWPLLTFILAPIAIHQNNKQITEYPSTPKTVKYIAIVSMVITIIYVIIITILRMSL